MHMVDRFADVGTQIYSFDDEILVVCPQCKGRALVRRQDPTSQDHFAPRRVSCGNCGFARDCTERRSSMTWRIPPVDGVFGLPLLLQAPCCGQILWAWNQRHLEFIEYFVRAKLRERQSHPVYGRFNSSLASRLPSWTKKGGNREEILKTIESIRRKHFGD